MYVRAVVTAVACFAMVACASTKTSQRASRSTANTVSKRVYQQSVTPRTSTPQPRRRPSWPAQGYRAPSVRTYAAAPKAKPAARRVVHTARYGTVPPPPPPPALSTLSAPRTVEVRPARAPAAHRAVIRPASRPARAAVPRVAPKAAAAAAAKPIAPVDPSSLLGGGRSSVRTSSPYGLWRSKRRGRDCKT